MVGSGLVLLWTVRRELIDLGHIGNRPVVGAAVEAFRRHRKTLAGGEPTAEIDSIDGNGAK